MKRIFENRHDWIYVAMKMVSSRATLTVKLGLVTLMRIMVDQHSRQTD